MAPDCVSSLSPATRARQAEVGDVRVAVLVDEDVGRLQVAVEDATQVGVMYGLGQRGHEPGGPRRVVAVGVQPARQRAARDELHGEESLAVVLADLVDRHDARRGRAPATASASFWNRRSRRVGEGPGPDHLQGDWAIQADLPRLVDDPHAAAAELAADLVVAKMSAWDIGGGGGVAAVGIGLRQIAAPPYGGERACPR